MSPPPADAIAARWRMLALRGNPVATSLTRLLARMWQQDARRTLIEGILLYVPVSLRDETLTEDDRMHLTELLPEGFAPRLAAAHLPYIFEVT